MATKTTTTAKVETKAAAKPEVKVETKAPAKKADEKVEVKKAETKVAAKKADEKVEAKKVETKDTPVKAETKVETKKAETKKAEAKPAAKKTSAKAATTKKDADKAATTKVFVQFYGKEVDTTAITEAAKADYIAKGGKKTGIKNVQIYIKPEDNAAYYVIEGVEGVITL